MTTTTTNAVPELVAAMLTENTGSHMLDSGGAYGRNWERNRGMTAAAFAARPEATIDQWGHITVDAFHYLCATLEMDETAAMLQSQWEAFDAAHPDGGWLDLMDDWLVSIGVGEDDRDRSAWNTYNWENVLSQTLQGQTFRYDGETYTLLQVHGGCDVRGGYTAPRVFKTPDYAGCGELMTDLILYAGEAEMWVEDYIPRWNPDQLDLGGNPRGEDRGPAWGLRGEYWEAWDGIAPDPDLDESLWDEGRGAFRYVDEDGTHRGWLAVGMPCIG